MIRAAPIVLVGLALAQFAPTPPKSVGLIVPDGGVKVSADPSLPVYVILPDGGTQVLQVEGRNGGPIVTQLDSNTLAAIAAPTCTVVREPPVIILTTGVVDVPTIPFAGRTQLIVKNLSSNRNVWCCVGAGCTPTSTAAYAILPNGDYQNFPVRDTDIVRCRSSAATADVNAQEAACE